VSVAVYVHFPYCLAKCPYCDFTSYARERAEIDHDGYADAVLRELEARAELSSDGVSSVFFGGGTPSLWSAPALGRVLAGILGGAPTGDEVEVTVECNPTSLSEDHARALRDQGVNRLSVGVQGLDAERLRFLGRLHGPDEGMRALEAALRSGMPRVSADLIFGIAGGGAPETAEQAAAEADRVAASGITHLSAYALTIEPQTRFGELARKGRLPVARDDQVAESFFAVEQALAARGLAHYAVSNFARPGEESRHNLAYWHGEDYVGLGVGAVGTSSRLAASVADNAPALPGAATRYRNHARPERYLEGSRAPRPARAGAVTESEERLDPETRLRERIMLGLRLREGVDLARAASGLALEPWPPHRTRAAERLVAAGRLVREGDRVRLPPAAWIFADGVAVDLW
jgi:putative oxygen-independent coproporphyrinogen III oxidase